MVVLSYQCKCLLVLTTKFIDWLFIFLLNSWLSPSRRTISAGMSWKFSFNQFHWQRIQANEQMMVEPFRMVKCPSNHQTFEHAWLPAHKPMRFFISKGAIKWGSDETSSQKRAQRSNNVSFKTARFDIWKKKFSEEEIFLVHCTFYGYVVGIVWHI